METPKRPKLEAVPKTNPAEVEKQLDFLRSLPCS